MSKKNRSLTNEEKIQLISDPNNANSIKLQVVDINK